jgi:hypothetical protein
MLGSERIVCDLIGAHPAPKGISAFARIRNADLECGHISGAARVNALALPISAGSRFACDGEFAVAGCLRVRVVNANEHDAMRASRSVNVFHNNANNARCVLWCQIKKHGGSNFFSGPLFAALGLVGFQHLGHPAMGKFDRGQRRRAFDVGQFPPSS